jgi:hypothetical protein
LPAVLTVDCASRKNYQQFRSAQDRVSLAGAVSMVNVKGKLGTYNAGSLFLYPVLKSARVGSLSLVALLPSGHSTFVSGPLLPAGHNEESFLALLGVPSARFIGFLVDVPFDRWRASTARFTNGRLPDGTSIGINWTVSNLNRPWFAGSPTIPSNTTCNGTAWRKLITEGLKQAVVTRC